ncbi:MAG: SDR family NAD(P)-dependent oxidoreductase [Lachnospiraceae bacterium]|nr:SDR family NAD(P)-dependent oxidoreductase [Lachnospiraceae bacterium]
MIIGKNIVITGGSSGIGKAILEILAKGEGNRILVACRSAAKITGFGDNVIPFACDLSSREGADALFEAIDRTFDKADIFIANAGAPYYEVYDYVNWDRVENIFNLNAITPMYTYAKYLEHLHGREGRLVYTISAMGEMALPGYALYTSTKFAMKGFQQAIRMEMPRNLKLTCVYPVSTDTNFFNVGGNGVEVERPFPVQSAEEVAQATVRAIEKNKKQVYPCPIYLPSKALMTVFPPARSIYWAIEKGRLRRFLKRKEKAEKQAAE